MEERRTFHGAVKLRASSSEMFSTRKSLKTYQGEEASGSTSSTGTSKTSEQGDLSQYLTDKRRERRQRREISHS